MNKNLQWLFHIFKNIVRHPLDLKSVFFLYQLEKSQTAAQYHNYRLTTFHIYQSTKDWPMSTQ